jgi:hypothetical protein
MFAEKSLVDIIHERVSANTLQLPVFHHVALKLMHILSKEDFSITQVAQLIMEDQALASHVLHMANSAFFGGLSQVTTIRDAIVRLGVRQVTNIVTVVTQSQQYRSKNKTSPHTCRPSGSRHSHALGSKWFTENRLQRTAQEALCPGSCMTSAIIFAQVLEDGRLQNSSLLCPNR